MSVSLTSVDVRPCPTLGISYRPSARTTWRIRRSRSAPWSKPGRQIICDEAEDALYGLAACLREELRGTDLAMRQGADRFLVLLADTDAAGAAAVMRRLEGSVEGIAQLRAGIAVYGSEHDTAERLAAAAAAALTRATDG
jgi:hypothetical protein